MLAIHREGSPWVAEDATADAPVNFSGSLTLEEWRQVQQFLGAKPRNRWIVFCGSLLFSVPIALFSTYHHFVPTAQGNHTSLFQVVLFWVFALFGLVVSPWLHRRSEKVLRQKKAENTFPFNYHEGKVTGNGIESRTPDCVSHDTWEAFDNYRDSPLVWIVYFPGHQSLHVLARSMFRSEADWERATSFVAVNVSKR